MKKKNLKAENYSHTSKSMDEEKKFKNIFPLYWLFDSN